MKRSPTELAYVTAALENARPADVVIILFDLLVGDLKNAIAAIQAKDVEKRSNDLKHGFLVLQQLQGSLDMENGGPAAVHFSRFYSSVRAQMMEAHVKASPEILQHQIELLRQVREAWQQVGQAQSAPSASPLPTPQPARQTTDEDTGASWTA
jgi:flagellar protein FliS